VKHPSKKGEVGARSNSSPRGQKPRVASAAASGAQTNQADPPSCPSSEVVSLSPVIWDDSAGAKRWWNGESILGNVHSSKAKPVEVCGVRGQLVWLMKAICPDGSHPFKRLKQAHSSRLGSMGAGGRCGKTVDLYKVPCPSKVYKVYMDLYHCTRSEVDKGRGPRGNMN